MKSILFSFFVLLTLGIPHSEAASSFAFPLPQGRHTVTNTPAGHDEKLDFDQYSVDFQVAEVPKSTARDYPEARCYSYGTPILAARDGVVKKAITKSGRHDRRTYGSYVELLHKDGSTTIYGHMIPNTNKYFVKPGDEVKQGQIIGLMGDSGNIESYFEDKPCKADGNFGTHLHFEIRGVVPPSLGSDENKNFQRGKSYTSTTIPHDPEKIYEKVALGKYPYQYQNPEFFHFSPIRFSPGEKAIISITGAHFITGMAIPSFSFCASQALNSLEEGKITFTCTVKEATGPYEGSLGQNAYTVHVGPKVSETSSITKISRNTPKPGELLDITIEGKALSPDLSISVEDTNNSSIQCQMSGKFSLLSAERLKTSCRMPLHAAPVEKESTRTFLIRLQDGEKVLSSESFTVNYGISGANLEPREAVYYTPTRFTITGKNVHRTTVFFIEGCPKDRIKILESSYDRLTLECWIEPLPGTDLSQIQGKTFPHLFLFKTQSRYNDQGGNILSDEEDEKNVVLSGYIDITYDQTEVVKDIDPKEAVIGKETIFTVKGKNLPYSTSSMAQALVWMELCSHQGKSDQISILPESYTPYGFQFACTPFLSTTSKSKSDFDKTQILNQCDSILSENWSEAEKNLALEACYKDSPSKIVQKSMWTSIQGFFSKLDPRKLHVKKSEGNNKILVSSKEVRVVSELYQQIQEEKLLEDITAEEGPFTITGASTVSKVLAASITRGNRRESITVLGSSLPKNLIIKSLECQDIKVSFASSERYQYICLLKKVANQEISVIHPEGGQELSHVVFPVVEVYDIKASETMDYLLNIKVSGVNLNSGITLSSPSCATPELVRPATSSELEYQCLFAHGFFSRPGSAYLQINRKEGVTIFEDYVPLATTPLITVAVAPAKLSLDPTDLEPALSKSSSYSINTDLIRVICDEEVGSDIFIGECQLESDFLRSGKVLASIEKKNQRAIFEGSFEAGIKGLDNFLDSHIKGLRINPASGKGLMILDVGDLSFLLNGEFKAFGVDATGLVNFPLSFDFYDVSGGFFVSLPDFNINKAREESKIVFGIGNLTGRQITLLQKYRDELSQKIDSTIRKSSSEYLNKKKLEIGAKIMNAIDDPDLKKLTRKTYIKMLKALEIVPETVAFYDNFDFVAIGKLKSEPFRPASMKEGSWIDEANLAQLNIDLSAKDARVVIRGDVLNSLSVFNNDILRTDRGLLNVGLRIELKRNNGMVVLSPVEIRLPLDIASVKAGISVEQLFNPTELTIRGNSHGGLSIKGFDIFKGEVDIAFDPNATYTVGNYTTQGFIHFGTEFKISSLATAYLAAFTGKGRVVFTHPGDELAMDFGGLLNLELFGDEKKLGDILGRMRVSPDYARLCFNSETGKFEFKVPYLMKRWKIFGGDTVTIHGAVSLDSELEFQGIPSIDTFLLSGKAGANDRVGFFWDNREGTGALGTVSASNKMCEDTPGSNFLSQIRQFKYEDGVEPSSEKQAAEPVFLGQQFSGQKILGEITPPALVQGNSSEAKTLWNIDGWMMLTPLTKKVDLIILNSKNEEVSLKEGSFSIPGVWIFENPRYFLITDEAAFGKSGYHFAIRGSISAGEQIGVALYTNNAEISWTYELPAFSSGIKSIDLTDMSRNKIKVGESSIEAKDAVTTPITDADRKVDVEISSDVQFDLPKVQIPPELEKAMAELKGGSGSRFPDIKSPLLREAVETLADKNIIKGYPDGSFQPDKTINRAEALKIIFEALSITQDQGSSGFPDVVENAWFASYVKQGKNKKIIQGYPDGYFRPDNSVTRAEFIKMAMSALSNYSDKTNTRKTLSQYQDLKARQWYLAPIAFAFEKGYLEKTKKFRPADGMTRGEAALILSRMIK